jgi:type 1 fimbriae regulatory protein FimB
MNTPSKRAPKRSKPQAEVGTRPRTSWSAATIQFLTQSEMRNLLAVIDSKRDYALFLLAYRHGLRASEVGMLRREDLDMNQYRLRIQRLKHSLSGLHPLQPDEVKAIKAYLRVRNSQAPSLFLSKRNEPISRRMLDKLMKTYGERAKLPDTKRHFHCLKHSIATHLLDAGADLRFVQDWIGHASIKNTVIYAQLTSRRRDEEARKVFASQYVV